MYQHINIWMEGSELKTHVQCYIYYREIILRDLHGSVQLQATNKSDPRSTNWSCALIYSLMDDLGYECFYAQMYFGSRAALSNATFSL